MQLPSRPPPPPPPPPQAPPPPHAHPHAARSQPQPHARAAPRTRPHLHPHPHPLGSGHARPHPYPPLAPAPPYSHPHQHPHPPRAHAHGHARQHAPPHTHAHAHAHTHTHTHAHAHAHAVPRAHAMPRAHVPPRATAALPPAAPPSMPPPPPPPPPSAMPTASPSSRMRPSPRISPTPMKPSRPVPLSRRRRRWVSRDVSHFQQLEQVGEGTYGQVWSAKDKRSGELVALKRVRMDNEKEGFPLNAIREIKLLKTLHHENIVDLKEIVTGKGSSKCDANKDDPRRPKGSIYMVFEYMDHDLTGLMDTPKIRFSEAQVKCYMAQLLRGLEYCHRTDVLHRDIKGSNLLLDNNGNLKIADFGLARSHGEPGRKYTNRVITLWYRPPELLLGANEYGPSVDMWSVGCLLAELLTRKPLFPGKDEAEQLDLIFQVVGSPTDHLWPKWRDLPQSSLVSESRRFAPQLPKYFRRVATHHGAPCSPAIVSLLQRMLMLDPTKRCTAAEALNDPWFQETPYACRKEDLPRHEESTHEFQAKRRRQASNLHRDGGARQGAGAAVLQPHPAARPRAKHRAHRERG